MDGVILLFAALMSALGGVLSQQRLRAAQRLVVLFVAVAAILVGTTAVASASSTSRLQPSSRITIGPAAETRVGVAATPIGTRVGLGRIVSPGQVGQKCPRFDGMVVGSCVATKAAGACSFTAETRVLMADGTTKPISEVEVGDMVMAVDPETGERGPRMVTKLWEHDDDELVIVSVGGKTLKVTPNHPLWVVNRGEWVAAGDLRDGDLLLDDDGTTVPVENVERVLRPGVDVHNLSVAGIHTYFVVVGRSSLLVHNAGACNLVSRIGENPRLVKEAERLAGTGQQASVDALTAQLNAGNLNPGIGTRSLFNGVFEARARDGARVYFRNGPDGVIEVLAKSTKANQQTVINILEKLYG